MFLIGALKPSFGERKGLSENTHSDNILLDKRHLENILLDNRLFKNKLFKNYTLENTSSENVFYTKTNQFFGPTRPKTER